VVIVGQQRALRLAVRDWRRAPRHTALDGLLAGSTEFAWPRAPAGADGGEDPSAWEGLMEAAVDE
jgi:hypothetical protein